MGVSGGHRGVPRRLGRFQRSQGPSGGAMVGLLTGFVDVSSGKGLQATKNNFQNLFVFYYNLLRRRTPDRWGNESN